MYFYMLPVFSVETQLILVEAFCVISPKIESKYKNANSQRLRWDSDIPCRRVLLHDWLAF